MSCKHGNWKDCELCQAEEDSFNNGLESGREEAKEEIENWKEGCALLLNENAGLKSLLDRISETTVPYNLNGESIFCDSVTELWNDVYPSAISKGVSQ